MLNEEVGFPLPQLAEPDGMIAVGGDLSIDRILCAYSMGIFPWYMDGSPILWWAPDPRLVLFPNEINVSKSMNKLIRKEFFKITMDEDFESVICNCASLRQNDSGGTWITDEMMEAYINLHQAGLCHSVESWYDGELVGGLYGISIGKGFFGESMFTKKSNASKAALIVLCKALMLKQFAFIDCQVRTNHLVSLGAKEIPGKYFYRLLAKALKTPTMKGKWNINDFNKTSD